MKWAWIYYVIGFAVLLFAYAQVGKWFIELPGKIESRLRKILVDYKHWAVSDEAYRESIDVAYEKEKIPLTDDPKELKDLRLRQYTLELEIERLDLLWDFQNSEPKSLSDRREILEQVKKEIADHPD